ncbi:SDR family NAD(P)-dependent oxidoreductase [Burkholderia cepacia]|uniref:SDR family NAD(P)-dependent oxidoreductase n=1 Tax=Burkholderia cepacia TaxID=292 RepID=UPI000F58FDD7|nr:SDR family NAD(P)-dependent oxidoreductase [Burkholderia cepacia]RQU90590.1 SDR family NAD(P)-dependent oxidoreductase [Burkholderia cenocepacia]RQV30417.1 SDR family NAD(P)-dependent oxidoreductase [Burkholderia cenocepacia]RQV88834.1 SDR family NAD(P)-dependent oxidoreductase [Burkholderia cenocepacia]RQZ91380.1 SDR family NAD(P)-dependent oxidoreductase [Burkholderia cepacia]RQZ98566.1 SDR family NAD(P)-dependent oxidoreductase [Burkholderia cenocepacia]
MHSRPVALVTGANKGIGLQIAKDLATKGFKVLVGARNLDLGTIAARSVGADAQAIHLDVTDQASISAAGKQINETLGRLDVLVNNAGISNPAKPGTPLEEVVQSGRLSRIAADDLRIVFETNVFGVVAVTQAMLPLLRKSPAGRIVNISSATGSLGLKDDPSNPFCSQVGVYHASKTALNAVTQAFAIELEGTGIKVNAACPGFTATDLSNFAEGAGSVEDAAREPVRLALLDANGPTGTFSNADGHIPW